MIGISEATDQVLQGRKLLWWQGVAYRRPEIRSTILAPMPLNWFIGWFRNWYFRLLQGPRDRISDQMEELLDRERLSGIEQGRKLHANMVEHEYQKGWEAHKQEINKVLYDLMDKREWKASS